MAWMSWHAVMVSHPTCGLTHVTGPAATCGPDSTGTSGDDKGGGILGARIETVLRFDLEDPLGDSVYQDVLAW
jgi:hypothetical protein